MNGTILYSGSCGSAGGQHAYIKNTSSSQRFRYTVEILENGQHFRNDSYTLDPGDQAIINMCTQVGVDSYRARIIGSVAI
jgi:hypothetical protein